MSPDKMNTSDKPLIPGGLEIREQKQSLARKVTFTVFSDSLLAELLYYRYKSLFSERAQAEFKTLAITCN